MKAMLPLAPIRSRPDVTYKSVGTFLHNLLKIYLLKIYLAALASPVIIL